MIYLMDEDEIAKLKKETRKHWATISLKDINVGIQFNARLVQQISVRLEVLREIKDERLKDSKSKQYPD